VRDGTRFETRASDPGANSPIDKIFMSSADQTAVGITSFFFLRRSFFLEGGGRPRRRLLTQGLSVPISAVGAARAGATPAVFAGLPPPCAAAVVATGLTAAGLGFASSAPAPGSLRGSRKRRARYTAAYQRASATSVTIASNANKAASVALSALLFGDALGAARVAGLALALSAATAYAVLPPPPERREKRS